MKRITVLLADDNEGVRQGFTKLLECDRGLEVIGMAKNGLQAVAMFKTHLPAVVLMDVAMPLLNGLQATSRILHADPTAKVLIFSTHSEEAYVEAATEMGAMGYLIKQISGESVCEAVRKVHSGGMFFSPSIPKHLRKQNRKTPSD
jgi:DNA-binding NarL/FixJ family response regulator